jgi:hypothetical protein
MNDQGNVGHVALDMAFGTLKCFGTLALIPLYK